MMGSSSDVLLPICTTVMTKNLPPLFDPNEVEEKPKSQNSLEKLFNSNLKNSAFDKMGAWKGSMIETLLIKSVSISKEPKPQQVRRHTRNISIYDQTDGPKLDTVRASRDELRIEKEKTPKKFMELPEEKKDVKSQNFDGFDDNFEANFDEPKVEQPKIIETKVIEKPQVNQPKIEQPKIIEPKIEIQTQTKPQIIEPKVEKQVQQPQEPPKKDNFDGFDDDFDPDFSQSQFTTDFESNNVNLQPKPLEITKEKPIELPKESLNPTIEYSSQQSDSLLSFLGSKLSTKETVKKPDSNGFGDLFNGFSQPQAPSKTQDISDLDFIMNKLKKKPPVEKKTFEGFDENSHFETSKKEEEIKIDDPKLNQFLAKIPDLSYLNANFTTNKKEFFEGFE